MPSRTRTIQKTNKFVIRRRTRKSNGKVYYELSLNYWDYRWSPEDLEQVRNIIDPTRNRSGHFGSHWKYQSRQEAEKVLTMLLMQL